MDKINLLLVDDDREILEALKTVVNLEVFQVFTATGVKEARELFGSRMFDVVVTDYQMGDGTGEEVRKLVRALQPQAKIALHSSTEEKFSPAFDWCYPKLDRRLLRYLRAA